MVCGVSGDIPSWNGFKKMMNIDNPIKEAGKRIYRCIEHNSPSLNLSGLGLYNMPHQIRQCTSVKRLYLRGNAIWDFSFLESLPQLELLYLQGNTMKNLRPLRHLKGLKDLNMIETEMNDATIVGELVQLENFFCGKNAVEDYRFLKNLPHLKSMALVGVRHHVQVPFGNLVNLENLNLERSRISNFQGLEKLIKLKSINLEWTRIKSVEYMRNMENLETLNLNNTSVTDLRPLYPLLFNKLKSLRVWGLITEYPTTKITQKGIDAIRGHASMYYWMTEAEKELGNEKK